MQMRGLGVSPTYLEWGPEVLAEDLMAAGFGDELPVGSMISLKIDPNARLIWMRLRTAAGTQEVGGDRVLEEYMFNDAVGAYNQAVTQQQAWRLPVWGMWAVGLGGTALFVGFLWWALQRR
jgi:hypothetical protein